MTSKVVRFCLLLLLSFGLTIVGPDGTARAHEPDSSAADKWFGKGGLSVIATSDQAQEFVAEPSFSLEVVTRIFSAANVWAAYRYQAINDVLVGPDNNLNDHAVKTMLFGRPPGTGIAPYIFTAIATTQTPDDTTRTSRATLDGGLGVVFPFAERHWGVELGAKRYKKDWLVSLQIAAWIALDGRKE